ncbi:hypothetical protein KZ483_10000 [Paenibacillus sp. sptzw28]|uniref:hypothetical protein n=1 Tax=Paenibacillus sp. sptzw28 TaxID=715179 RepID=UPI001C6E4DFA|nr:hypothetical protein [Paenibacillus sp. sptzw28]QYR23215.1 hypothetical protein KZ483_10000 [Paenibacillus sp. sptzw28]
MTNESESYIDAMHGILSHKGWTDRSKPVLSGMTVSGFRFTVNRRLTAESPTAYNWIAENFLAADFLGITSSQQAGYQFDATFPLYRKQAVSDIKKSIDRGIGAVFWKDKFVIAAGYDDNLEVLYYTDGLSDEYLRLCYTDFGTNVSPYWYYQILEDKIELDELEIYKESLIQAVYKWEQHDLMLPEADYACGRAAYDAIIQALKTGDYDPENAAGVFRCYAAAKRDIALYTAFLQTFWPQINIAAAHYGRLAQIFGHLVESKTPSEQIDLFVEAQRTETNAVQSIKALMRETIENRFNDISLR